MLRGFSRWVVYLLPEAFIIEKSYYERAKAKTSSNPPIFDRNVAIDDVE